MPTNDKERDFADFSNQAWPGKILPEYFNNVSDAGDGNPGLQRAVRNWAKWYLHSGNLDSGINASNEDVFNVANLNVNDSGVFGNRIITTDVTGQAGSISGFSNIYLHEADFKGDILASGNIYGDLDVVSGFESISANTGIFHDLKGFSDIKMQDSLDFDNTYHIKNASQITGTNVKITTANITNASITNVTKDMDFGGSYDIKNVKEISGGLFTGQVTGGIKFSENLDANNFTIENLKSPTQEGQATRFEDILLYTGGTSVSFLNQNYDTYFTGPTLLSKIEIYANFKSLYVACDIGVPNNSDSGIIDFYKNDEHITGIVYDSTHTTLSCYISNVRIGDYIVISGDVYYRQSTAPVFDYLYMKYDRWKQII